MRETKAERGWFLHGKFFFSSSGDSIRIKGLRKKPRASIAYFEGEKLLINARFKGHHGGSAFDRSLAGLDVRLDADRFFT